MQKTTLPIRSTCFTFLTITLMLNLCSASTPRTGVSLDQALSDAQKVAEMNPNWRVMRCTGNSMEPYFGVNSLLLVQSVNFEDLQKGMIVIYRDHEGQLIGHKVATVAPDRVIAQGENNWVRDPEPIVRDNLIGVVFATLHSSGECGNPGARQAVDTLPLVYGKNF